jgi:hypothetical protein
MSKSAVDAIRHTIANETTDVSAMIGLAADGNLWSSKSRSVVQCASCSNHQPFNHGFQGTKKELMLVMCYYFKHPTLHYQGSADVAQ